MHAVQLTVYGNPVDGLEYVDLHEPDPPGANEVLVGVELSPINPNDLMLARGIYSLHPELPTVIGNEGWDACSRWAEGRQRCPRRSGAGSALELRLERANGGAGRRSLRASTRRR